MNVIYLAMVNGTNKPRFHSHTNVLGLLRPVFVVGFFTLLSGISILAQLNHYPGQTVRAAFLGLALILSGVAFVFISSAQLRWRLAYHLFALPMSLYIFLIAYALLSGPRPVTAPLWPLIGFLVLGYMGARNETNRLQITLS